MKQVIKNIGERVINKFFDFDNNNYELENALIENHNGIYEAEKLSMSFFVEIGKHAIGCALSMTGKKVDYVEAIFEDGKYENIQEALSEYVEKNLDTDELKSLAIDDATGNSMDEYQRNGFANRADFYHYIFG